MRPDTATPTTAIEQQAAGVPRTPGRLPRLRRASAGTNVLFTAAGVITLLLVAIPIVALLWSGFSVSPGGLPFAPDTRFSISNYTEVLGDGRLVEPLVNTLVFVAGSLAISMVISLGLAVAFERTNIPLRGTLFALIIGPIAMPQVVAGISWGLLLDPQAGILNKLLQLLPWVDGPGPIDASSLLGITIVQGFLLVPFSLLLLAPVVRSTSGALEKAAIMTGASRWARMFRISLPLMAPGLVSVLVYQFVTAAQAFDIPAVLGLQKGTRIISTSIYALLNPTVGVPDYGRANALSVLLLLFALVPMYWYYRMMSRSERYAAITGKSYRRRTFQLRGFGRWITFSAVFTYVFVVVILPLFILLWMSLHSYYSTPSIDGLTNMTLSAYSRVFTLPAYLTTIRNSLILGVVAATIVCVLAVLNSALLLRRRGSFGKIIDAAAFVTHGIPGVVLGVSLLFLSLLAGARLGLHLYGSMALLVLGMVIVTLGLTTRITAAGMSQIHRNLEDAADVCGIGPLTRLRRVTLPLMAPAVANAWVVVLAAALSNLTLTVVLASANNRVVAVELFTRWTFGDVQTAAVLGLLLTIISMGATLAVRRYAERREVYQ